LFLQNIISSRKRFSSLGDRLKNENTGIENTGLARRLLETLCLLSTHLEAYHAAPPFLILFSFLILSASART